MRDEGVDIAERRRLDEELRNSDERFRLFVANVQDYAMFMLDPDGKVTTWNAGARRMKGYQPEAIIGRHFSLFYPPEDVAAGKPDRELVTAADEGRVEDEGWRVRQNGERFWANVVITALRNPDGTLRGFGKITRDLTERHRAEVRLGCVSAMRTAVARALASSRTLEAASEGLLGDIGEAMGWDVGELWLSEQPGDLMRMANFWSAAGVDADALRRRGQELAIAPGAVWERAEPRFVEDTGSDPEVLRSEEAVAAGLRQALGFPIIHDGVVVGAITFLARDMHDIDDALLAVLADLGRQIGQFVGRRLAEEAQLESERSFRSLFEGNPQAIFVAEKDTFRILAANEAAVAQYGYSRDELLGMATPALRWPEDSALWEVIARTVAQERRGHFTGVRHRARTGHSLDVEVRFSEVHFEGRTAWLEVVDDVSERMRLHRELEHQAFHDSLTGLPNRALFHNRVEHEQERLVRGSRRYAVLLLGLDNFRSVISGLGHGPGDQVLLEVSRRLAGGMRPGDTVGRLGGDEFGIILQDLEGDAEAVAVAGRLLTVLRSPFEVAGRSMTLAATIGIAVSGGAAAVAADVVRNASVALLARRAAGGDGCVLFSEEMYTEAIARLTVEQELREGIRRGELALRYQPKVDSRAGIVVGVEALVRWDHPLRGLLTPDAFIAVAEESALIIDLDTWVLETACRQASAWAQAGAGPLSVAVNVSGRTLQGGGLLEQVRRVLAETGLDPRSLELELTETAAVRQEAEALGELREIRALGVRIAIDDFGTGYSMLSRLQDFPIDTLKIDRSFISRITDLDADSPIVAATVAMGRGLGLEVVAEGVETEQQRCYLVRHGCARLQGYLISRPVGPERIPAMLLAPPVPPIEDSLLSAPWGSESNAAVEPASERLMAGLLLELQRLTGIESVYLTRVHWDRDEEEILLSRNSGAIMVPEGVVLPLRETLPAARLIGGAPHVGRLPHDVELPQSLPLPVPPLQTAVRVPILLRDGTMFGTLGGASERRLPLAQPGYEALRIFADLIAAKIAGSAALAPAFRGGRPR